jgi:Na+/phosphate symporter
MNLVPFAGIAFLWFIGVLRARLGAREDKLFATVFLGSGLLFVGMLFAGSAVMGALLALEQRPGPLPPDTAALGQGVTSVLLGTFGARMAAVFALSVTTAGLRTAVMPRWIAIVGYSVALVLLLSPPISGWSQLLFPGWVLLVSVFILISDEPPLPDEPIEDARA